MLTAEIYIILKKTVADPQGLTVKHALDSLGYKGIEEVRVGKLITIKLGIKDKRQTQKQLDDMCKKLLANPIIEEYSFVIKNK